MSLFIRCDWMPSTSASMDERLKEVSDILPLPTFTAVAGHEWYLLGKSRAEALAKPVGQGGLVQLKFWRRVPLIEGKVVYTANLWNGRDGPCSTNISGALHLPPDQPDTFVISGINAENLRASGVPWSAVVDLCGSISERLGGVARVSSNELLDRAPELLGTDAPNAAFAACWGIDRSERNPSYRIVRAAGTKFPFFCVSANDWKQVLSPVPERLREITSFLQR